MDDLRVGDIQTFLAVQRWSSITAAARSLRVTPSQVSKAIARLEGQLGVRLFARGARGVSLSVPGRRALPALEDVVKRLESLRVLDAAPELTIAAPAFLNALFLPAIAAARHDLRFRGIELPPALVHVYAADAIFEVALTLGSARFPDTWQTTKIGSVEKTLFARPSLAKRLGAPPVAPERLASIPFITPVYAYGGQFLIADEGCPIGNKRKLGHEVQTMALGLDLAARTDQLVFGPRIAARAYLASGALVEIEVRGWDVREDLSVACNAERVLAADQRDIVEVVRQGLAELEA